MGGIVGRLFREFAVTLSVTILVSLVVSLTTTPMMCARLLSRARKSTAGIYQRERTVFDWILGGYERSLTWVLRHPRCSCCWSALATIGAERVTCSSIVPKGFFPQQDTGRLNGTSWPTRTFPSRRCRTRCAQLRDNRPERSRRGDSRRVHRRRRRHDDQHRPHVHRAEAARGAQSQRRPDHQPPAAETRRGSRRDALSAGRAGRARRRPAEQRRNINTRCRATISTI